jgi:hypothetical protein
VPIFNSASTASEAIASLRARLVQADRVRRGRRRATAASPALAPRAMKVARFSAGDRSAKARLSRTGLHADRGVE